MWVIRTLGAIASIARAIFDALGWFGLSTIISGYTATAFVAIQATAQGVPWPMAFLVGICAAVAILYLAILPAMFRAVRVATPPPVIDEVAWAGRAEYRLTDAACLLAGVPTARYIEADHPAWAWYTALVDAIRQGNIAVPKTRVARDGQGRPTPDFDTPISAGDFRSFTESRGLRPRFLWPNG